MVGRSKNGHMRGKEQSRCCAGKTRVFCRPHDKKATTIYEEDYLISIWARLQTWGDDENMLENPGIDTLWGNWDILCTWEQSFGPIIHDNILLHIWADAHLSKSSYWVSFGFWPTVFSWRRRFPVRIPITPYIRYYSGKNEFLEYYTQRKRWFAWGVLLKR